MKGLPPELRALVRDSTSALGQVVRRQAGSRVYRRVETVRQEMKEARSASRDKALAILRSNLTRLRRTDPKDQYAIAHAFALMMELINVCENAYRTFRLRNRKEARAAGSTEAILYVLTAHPTEARSVPCIRLFEQIQDVLLRSLETGKPQHADLEYLLTLAWKIPMANTTQPSVRDEAEYLFSVALGSDALSALLDLKRRGTPVHLRSWVGGDKDGHPYVQERTLRQSLQTSRRLLLEAVQQRVAAWRKHLSILEHEGLSDGGDELADQVALLRRLGPGDGKRVTCFRDTLGRHMREAEKCLRLEPPELAEIALLLEIFPGLVLPLEVREASDVFAADEATAVRAMLEAVASISAGADPRWYVAGLVVSMVERPEHVLPPLSLIHETLGESRLPVVPLLENEAALLRSEELIDAMLRQPELRRVLRGPWGRRFEIMLGYSDSAKEMGAFSSRWLIRQALLRLDRLCARHEVRPIFFHGTGGSVARGGGSVEDQTRWWPRSARRVFKSTLQGEMVHRTFASPEILVGQASGLWKRLGSGRPSTPDKKDHALLERFATAARARYQETVHSDEFLSVVAQATPYRYLKHLRIGSRPVKRGGELSVESLRAIPWVLCWTQTRVLFPAWWGCGSAWRGLSDRERRDLRRLCRTDPFVRSFVQLLGFTLQKVELPIWRLLLQTTDVAVDVEEVFRSFEAEYRDTVAFVRDASGERSLLWFRPWLKESIALRTTMIHPLNLIQILALERGDNALLRETVTGISSGMLTTG